MASNVQRAGLALIVVLMALPAMATAGDGPAFRYTLVDRFGEKGSGPSAFKPDEGPVGVTVDHLCGDIYVSDEAKQRVQRFSQRGRFLNYIGRPAGDEFIDEGEFETPVGLDVFAATAPDNFHGPPTRCSGLTTLTTNVWVADTIANRVAIFEPDGSWTGSWCNQDLDVGGCDLVDNGSYDYYPVDIDATSSRVYVAGLTDNTVREFDRQGTLMRRSEPAVSGAYSTSVFGGQLWLTQRFDSSVGLYSLDPGNDSINRYHELGTDFSSARGKFTYPRALTAAPNGRLFVLDDGRVLTFMPSGRYLNEFDLPEESFGEDIFARHDGTLFIADNSRTRPGILVYSPGPVVSLKLRALGGRQVAISGGVRPGHRRAKLRIERLAADGWNKVAKLRLDRGSRYAHEWKAPRKRIYVFRAFFRDPHDYHADRTSQYKKVRVE